MSNFLTELFSAALLGPVEPHQDPLLRLGECERLECLHQLLAGHLRLDEQILGGRERVEGGREGGREGGKEGDGEKESGRRQEQITMCVCVCVCARVCVCVCVPER